MLYNKDKKKVKTNVDCLTCIHYDKTKKKCNGIGKTCFEFDPKTRTVIDPITKMPIKLQ